jgi:tetratricopeptide (TPR) repeat protein
MASDFQHPYPDAEIDALIQRLKKQLRESADRLDELRPALEAGKPLGELHAVPLEDAKALYTLAARLCDEGEFRHALPIALHLSAYHPTDPRHAFMAAACLQRLGLHEDALAMYQLCMAAAGAPQAGAMYRAGECLMAMGEKEPAMQAFEQAFDLGRASSDYASIQDMASERIEQLRAGA